MASRELSFSEFILKVCASRLISHPLHMQSREEKRRSTVSGLKRVPPHITQSDNSSRSGAKHTAALSLKRNALSAPLNTTLCVMARTEQEIKQREEKKTPNVAVYFGLHSKSRLLSGLTRFLRSRWSVWGKQGPKEQTEQHTNHGAGETSHSGAVNRDNRSHHNKCTRLLQEHLSGMHFSMIILLRINHDVYVHSLNV